MKEQIRWRLKANRMQKAVVFCMKGNDEDREPDDRFMQYKLMGAYLRGCIRLRAMKEESC